MTSLHQPTDSKIILRKSSDRLTAIIPPVGIHSKNSSFLLTALWINIMMLPALIFFWQGLILYWPIELVALVLMYNALFICFGTIDLDIDRERLTVKRSLFDYKIHQHTVTISEITGARLRKIKNRKTMATTYSCVILEATRRQPGGQFRYKEHEFARFISKSEKEWLIAEIMDFLGLPKYRENQL